MKKSLFLLLATTSLSFNAYAINGKDLTYFRLKNVKLEEKWGYMDNQANVIIEPQFDSVRGFADNGLAMIEQNGKYGFINSNGKVVIPPQFDDAGNFANNGLAYIKQNGKYGYINSSGKVVIPPQFDDVLSFSDNGLARVKQNGKYGYINNKGAFVIQPQFDELDYSFAYNGLAQVKQNGKLGYINEQGNYVAKIKTICDVEILVKPTGEAIYPKNYVVADICAEANYYRDKKAQAEQQKQQAELQKKLQQTQVQQDNPDCSGFYVGKVVSVKNQSTVGSLLGMSTISLKIVGLDKKEGLVSVKDENGNVQNGSCYGLKQGISQ